MATFKPFHPSARPAGRGITIGTPRLYDLSGNLFFFGMRRRAYRTLLEAAEVRSGDDVLDVGCGPGYFTRMLALPAGSSGSATGLDAAPEMVEYATHKARSLDNCSFRTGSAEELPFTDGSFDVVVSSLMLHHLPDETRLTAVFEMKRVLRGGGRLLLADFSIPERGIWHVVGSVTGHSRAQAHMMRRVSPLEPLVSEAGFIDLRSGDTPPWLHYVRATKAA
jgi:ubiquinone/menaquinone biosynthesis C-methylase UbiE